MVHKYTTEDEHQPQNELPTKNSRYNHQCFFVQHREDKKRKRAGQLQVAGRHNSFHLPLLADHQRTKKQPRVATIDTVTQPDTGKNSP